MKFPPVEIDVSKYTKEELENTTPWDSRFPNQNQSKHCYVSFVDFQRCKKLHGEEYEACQFFKKAYMTLCPLDWIEKWNEQLAENTFPGRI